jgi:hypothetical protein
VAAPTEDPAVDSGASLSEWFSGEKEQVHQHWLASSRLEYEQEQQQTQRPKQHRTSSSERRRHFPPSSQSENASQIVLPAVAQAVPKPNGSAAQEFEPKPPPGNGKKLAAAPPAGRPSRESSLQTQRRSLRAERLDRLTMLGPGKAYMPGKARPTSPFAPRPPRVSAVGLWDADRCGAEGTSGSPRSPRYGSRLSEERADVSNRVLADEFPYAKS